jgi:glycosyltransferase involved in cell wall biosynthesis
MRIMVLHNRYRIAGGEDVVAAAEAALLQSRGHDVTLVEVDNHAIRGPVGAAGAALGTPYNPWRRRWIAREVRRSRAELVHVHNYFPLLSPAVVDGAADAGAAIVHTLHNYRAICANAQMLRRGAVCDQCVGGSGWPAIRHRCYRGSAMGTAAVVAMQQVTRRLDLWNRPGRQLIALSHFARDRFAEAGLPSGRITVKPNFIDLPDVPAEAEPRSGVVFVGRLSPEKGAAILIEAARSLPGIAFTLIGEGPQAAELETIAPANVRFAGALPRAEARAAIARARMLAMPSLWYEGLPMTLLEAHAAATPVVGSRIGALAEWIEDGVTGALVEPGDAAQLIAAIRRIYDDPAMALRLGKSARARAEARFSPAANGEALEAIYARAIGELGHA